MDKIITSSGREIPVDHVATIPDPERAYIVIRGMSLPEVATLATTPGELDSIRYGDHVLEDYSRIVAITPLGDMVRLSLARR